MTPKHAAIVGLAGPKLLSNEAALLRAYPPAGVILFARNVRDPGQLAALMDELRGLLPLGAVLMVDQEGGRVARLRPPHWRAHPTAGAIGAVFETSPDRGVRAAYLTGALIGVECAAAGFNVVCAPVLDLRIAGASDVIGDRSYGAAPDAVASLGHAMAEGLLAAGVQPVGKHAPGHGRADLDTHFALPVVTAPTLDDDLQPFVANADLPWLMTAHVVYPAYDRDQPATLSATIVQDVIRGRIGFRGVLCSDDLAMQALTGPPAARALRALEAGCDIALYCPGDADGTASVLGAVPLLTVESAARLAGAAALAQDRRKALDPAALQAERDTLLP